MKVSLQLFCRGAVVHLRMGGNVKYKEEGNTLHVKEHKQEKNITIQSNLPSTVGIFLSPQNSYNLLLSLKSPSDQGIWPLINASLPSLTTPQTFSNFFYPSLTFTCLPQLCCSPKDLSDHRNLFSLQESAETRCGPSSWCSSDKTDHNLRIPTFVLSGQVQFFFFSQRYETWAQFEDALFYPNYSCRPSTATPLWSHLKEFDLLLTFPT